MHRVSATNGCETFIHPLIPSPIVDSFDWETPHDQSQPVVLFTRLDRGPLHFAGRSEDDAANDANSFFGGTYAVTQVTRSPGMELIRFYGRGAAELGRFWAVRDLVPDNSNYCFLRDHLSVPALFNNSMEHCTTVIVPKGVYLIEGEVQRQIDRARYFGADNPNYPLPGRTLWGTGWQVMLPRLMVKPLKSYTNEVRRLMSMDILGLLALLGVLIFLGFHGFCGFLGFLVALGCLAVLNNLTNAVEASRHMVLEAQTQSYAEYNQQAKPEYQIPPKTSVISRTSEHADLGKLC